MSPNSNGRATNLALIETINAVEGFDPTVFAVDYTDMNTGETRKRLPVMIQMAWFRLRYPEGKIAVTVEPGNECFVATARVYPHYDSSIESYLAEATASRGHCPDKPSVSPREWAQTAAVGIALRNAGFGLQFSLAGEEFEPAAPNEFAGAAPATPVELTPEQKLAQALALPCPITKYSGKTLGDMVSLDPNSLVWLATRYKGSEEISAAAKLICENAAQNT